MNRILIVLGFLVVFAIGFVSANIYDSYPGRSGTLSRGRTHELTDMVGTQVENPRGDQLGKISDFLIDGSGQVTFAILSYDNKLVAVPFWIFSYDREGNRLVLDTTKENLSSAPAFAKDSLSGQKWAVEAYKHFGHQPYWTYGIDDE